MPENCNTTKIQIKGPNLWLFLQKDANGIANSEDPDQTAPREEQSDLGLHCLPRPICPKTWYHYGNPVTDWRHISIKTLFLMQTDLCLSREIIWITRSLSSFQYKFCIG